MLNICYICFRSDVKLQPVNDELENLYDEFCNFYADNLVQFCSQCTYKLKKCYDFKKTCQSALKKLLIWKKKVGKKSTKQLFQENSDNHLSLWSSNNYKVYFCKANEYDRTTVQISNSHSSILTLNIPQIDSGNCDDVKHDIKVEHTDITNDYDVTKFESAQIDDDDENNSADFEFTNTKTELDKYDLELERFADEQNFGANERNFGVNEHNFGVNEQNFGVNEQDFGMNEQNSDKNESVDSDSSIDELLSKFKKRKPVKKVRSKKVFNLDDLKKMLLDKFETFGVVKDSKGDKIEIENVMSGLDKLPLKILKNIGNICSGPGPLKPVAIQKLSELQSRFAKFEAVFNTIYLSDRTQILEEFERRRHYTEYASAEHRCETCIRGFRHVKTLDYHNRTYHHESAGAFVCSYCQMRFRAKMALRIHTATHSVVYKCKMCHFVTNHRSAMVKHFENHSGVKYHCKYCQKEFKTESVLYRHINEKHNTSSHICNLCAQAFNKEKGLLMHKNLKHHGVEFTESAENAKCDECNVLFINNDVFNKHMNITHKLMDEATKNRRKCKIMKVACKLCKTVGKSPGWLMGHFFTEHPTEDMALVYSGNKKYLCHDCGKGFNNVCDFKDHGNTHTGVKPYACDKCPKKFYRKKTLSKHVERHMPPSRECTHCGKMFVTSSYLASHMRTHTGDRRYKCEICGKGFLYPATLREHVNGVHFNIKRKRKHAAIE